MFVSKAAREPTWDLPRPPERLQSVDSGFTRIPVFLRAPVDSVQPVCQASGTLSCVKHSSTRALESMGNPRHRDCFSYKSVLIPIQSMAPRMCVCVWGESNIQQTNPKILLVMFKLTQTILTSLG